ncbi:hypothetical protein [Pseudonocardia endophytica]|uniref:Secreted protein n=1 Tax=Pseudonocardia endophytica TaxID=401976 RepID=A0A4R1HSN6_PSEEN|nr:hypothetical protein [Pseudonocardia endophytica]TCK25188.1 hypothetical protein EV378_0986 [Pseudonocardia endophytica]
MNARKRLMTASLGLAGLVLPLAAVGTAQADEENPAEGYPSTQSPLQAVSGVGATLGEANHGLLDALNGDDRPDGANGVETEFPPLDYRYVEGPVGGLLTNGPFQ